MRVAAIDIMRITIPFRVTFTHALASRDRADSLLVRVRDEDGRAGYGEGAPRSYVSGETTDGARDTIERKLAPPWHGAAFDRFEDVVAALSEAYGTLRRDEHAAFCALELAILDLAGRVFHGSAGDPLGPLTRAHVRYSGVVSADGVDRALEFCRACRQMGLASVKLKVGRSPETDGAVLEGARRILGEECSLRIDANGAWSADEALERIRAYQRYRIDGVEQPVAADDLAGLTRVTVASPVPVIVDESLVSYEDGLRLIDAAAAHIFNIRVSKNGGLLAAARLRDLAITHGLSWMLGAQVGETAILSAAGRQLATRGREARWCEGSFGTLLLRRDVSAESVTFGPGGRAPALEGDGLGVTVTDESLGELEAASIVGGAKDDHPGEPR